MNISNRFPQEELLSEDLNSEKEIGRFSLNRKGGKVTLDCVVTRRWENIFLLVLKCGNRQEHKMTSRKGITRSERQTLETTMKASAGIGVAEFESEVKAQIEQEVTFEESLEVEKGFPFEAPKCGRLTAAIFQCTRVYHLKYRDDRFLHKDAWQKKIVEWLPIIRDESKTIENDPDCGCAVEPKDGFKGLVRMVGQKFSFLDTYKPGDNQNIILNTLRQSIPGQVAVSGEIGGAETALKDATPRGMIPPHLLFLADVADEAIRLQVKPYVPQELFDSEQEPTQLQLLETLALVQSTLQNLTTRTMPFQKKHSFGGPSFKNLIKQNEARVKTHKSGQSEVAQ